MDRPFNEFSDKVFPNITEALFPGTKNRVDRNWNEMFYTSKCSTKELIKERIVTFKRMRVNLIDDGLGASHTYNIGAIAYSKEECIGNLLGAAAGLYWMGRVKLSCIVVLRIHRTLKEMMYEVDLNQRWVESVLGKSQSGAEHKD